MNRALTHHTLIAGGTATITADDCIAAVRTVPAGSASWGVGHRASASAACGTGRKESQNRITFATAPPSRSLHPRVRGVLAEAGTTLNVCGVRTSPTSPKVVPDVRNLSAARATARGTHSNRTRRVGRVTTGTTGRRHAA